MTRRETGAWPIENAGRSGPTDVTDLPQLFELMFDDMMRAPEIFRPTPYWAPYVAETAGHIRAHGLRNFRGGAHSVLATFNARQILAIDVPVSVINNSDLDEETKQKLTFFLHAMNENRDAPVLPHGISLNELHRVAYRIADLHGQACGARPLATIEASLVGNPPETIDIDGRKYTFDFLEYYWLYADVCRFVDFDQIDSIIEIGPGIGGQAEVIRKLHPHISFYLLDLATALYISNRWLDATFPGEVASYELNRFQKGIRAPRPGSILSLGNWQIGDIEPSGTTLFWNAASFGEMEPGVVAAYLGEVRRHAKFVHLVQAMEGKHKSRLGPAGRTHGVLEQTLFQHYVDFLGPGYELIERAKAFHPLGPMDAGSYDRALWVR